MQGSSVSKPSAAVKPHHATDYLAQNKIYYHKEFGRGYGHHYPESHVIKLYNRILATYFSSKGFDVYGVDISSIPIDKCRQSLPDIKDHFQVISPSPHEDDIFFDRLFDVVFSNQVLYLLSEDDFDARVGTLVRHLKPDGVFIATMMGSTHYFYSHSTPVGDGLRRVMLSDDPKDQFFLRFTESEDHLKAQFSLFEPLYVGYYDINLCEDSGFHYVFVGRPMHSDTTSMQRDTAD
jgi:SAM-dependent methyltransferase